MSMCDFDINELKIPKINTCSIIWCICGRNGRAVARTYIGILGGGV